MWERCRDVASYDPISIFKANNLDIYTVMLLCYKGAKECLFRAHARIERARTRSNHADTFRPQTRIERVHGRLMPCGHNVTAS